MSYGGYDVNDPKHPGYFDRLADSADLWRDEIATDEKESA